MPSPKPAASWLLLLLVAVTPGVLANGIGLIGFGKTMFQPPCAFACRSVVASCPLRCSPPRPDDKKAPVAKTPESCYVSDPAFMQTVALCIATYCPGSGAGIDDRLIEDDYWPSHLPSNNVANFSLAPAMTYQQALVNARRDEQRSVAAVHEATTDGRTGHHHHDNSGSPAPPVLRARHGAGHGQDDDKNAAPVNTTLPVVKRGAMLNTTSFVRASDWLMEYNSLVSFEANEVGNSLYTIIITIVPFLLAIAASLPQLLLPALTRSPSWAWFKSLTVYPPLWGSRHREPVSSLVLGIHSISGGGAPTRGQSVYIAVVVALNAAVLIAPYSFLRPQIWFDGLRAFELNAIGCRAGVLAMGNVVVLVALAGRNLLPLPAARLLLLTGGGAADIWAHDNRLLLHRVFGYLAVAHTILHAVLLLVAYIESGSYAEESAEPFWAWGVVGAVAAVIIVPASVGAVRRRFYELFLAAHRLLAAVFLVAYFFHILNRFRFKWGYEIWCYVAVALWALERLLRLVRIVRAVAAGCRAAHVALVPASHGEYLRIDIGGVRAPRGGHVFLYFPTLGWRFWENHPFSVASSSSSTSSSSSSSLLRPMEAKNLSSDDSDSRADDRSSPARGAQKDRPAAANTATKQGAATTTSSSSQNRVSLFVRVQSGMTARLAARVTTSTRSEADDAVPNPNPNRIRIPVLVEGPYHASPAAKQLSRCSSIICIAGGVGISAVVPLLLQSSDASNRRRLRLCWGVRSRCLVDECEPDMLRELRAVGVNIEISVGSRLDILAILRQELLAGTAGSGTGGPVGVVVCGPPTMADEVRNQTTRLARSGAMLRGLVLVDEAFTW